MALTIQEADALVVSLKQTLESNYSAVSALTFLVYDSFSTLSEEVEYIWQARWSLTKVLYIFARYYGLVYLSVQLSVNIRTNIPLQFCQRYLWYYGYGGPILFTTAVNMIFMMRVYVLYNRSKKVLVFLVLVALAEFLGEMLITTQSIIRAVRTVFVAPMGLPWPGCLASPSTTFALIGWVPCLVIAAIFFAMTLAKFINVSHRFHPQWRWRNLNSKLISPLFMTMFQDGTVFFFLIFFMVLICMVINLTVKNPLGVIGTPWLIAIYSLSGSRLILNLRKVAKRSHLYGLDVPGVGCIIEEDPIFLDTFTQGRYDTNQRL